jgi:hypothetical protein
MDTSNSAESVSGLTWDRDRTERAMLVGIDLF